MVGPFIGIRGEAGGGGGWDPKSPYHMPRKILGKEIAQILIICFFLIIIFSFEQLIQYFCQVHFHRPFIFDVRDRATIIK